MTVVGIKRGGQGSRSRFTSFRIWGLGLGFSVEAQGLGSGVWGRLLRFRVEFLQLGLSCSFFSFFFFFLTKRACI